METQMRKRPTHCLVTAVLIILGLLAGCGEDDKNTPLTLERLLNQVMREYELPGMAAARITTDSIESVVAGVRRLGSGAKIEPDDYFHIGSNTKAMTADIIAKLVEEGKLSWSSKAADIIPGLDDSVNVGFADITITQVLTHRAGIQAFTDGNEFLALPDFSGSGREQGEQFARWLLKRPPTYDSGSFHYSNAGYAIAGVMAEVVTDKTYQELLGEVLFDPLEIDGKLGWPALTDPAQPWGHYEEAGEMIPHDPHDEYAIPVWMAPAGDMSMSIEDYAVFVQWHLRALRGMPTILSAQSFTALHTPDGEYAKGWGVSTINGALTYAHEGSAGTFDALVVIQPDRDVAAAVFTNAAGTESLNALSSVAAEILGIDLPASKLVGKLH
jgi:CubicO group peptidase (beta-lactamase class C family)